MNLKRCILVIILGSLSGAIWATVFVDFVPTWFGRLGEVPAVSILLMPLALSLVCGAVSDWWRFRACAAYGVVVLAWHIPGQVYNELVNVGNLSHWSPAVMEAGMWLAEFALIVGCWNMGRFLRRMLKGEFRPEAG